MKPEKRLDCLVVGEAAVDLLIDGAADLEVGKEKLAQGMEFVLGGSSSITAYNLARLGAHVAFVGLIGQDIFGQFIADKLSCAKVNIEGLQRVPHRKTGITIWYSRKGRRAGLTYPGTIAMLRATDVTELQLRQARHLHVGHYFLLKSFHAGAPALFRRARELGITTSLDCNHDPAERWQSGIRRVLKHVDIFFPNDAEALSLSGCPNVKAAAQELGKLARIICVKCGSRGVLIHTGTESFRMAAVKAKVVDTTGAGDSFNAGFLSRFVQGASLRDCAEAGLIAASRCVTRFGGTAAFDEKWDA